MNFKRLKRYWMMLRLISIGGGYSRAEYLKKNTILRELANTYICSRGILEQSQS